MGQTDRNKNNFKGNKAKAKVTKFIKSAAEFLSHLTKVVFAKLKLCRLIAGHNLPGSDPFILFIQAYFQCMFRFRNCKGHQMCTNERNLQFF